MRMVAGLGAVVVLLFLAFQALFGSSTVSWNQRLTLVIETPQGEVRGSAVTRVEVVEYSGSLMIPDGRGPRATVSGEAVAVEVLPGRWLFALLEGSEREQSSAKAWVYAAYPHEEQKTGSVRMHDLVIGAVRSQPYGSPVPLPPGAWPMMVTFDDITKPETVGEVDPRYFKAVFGEGVWLRAVTLEITEEPVTEGRIEGVLEWWLGPYPEPALGPATGGLLADAPFYRKVHMGNFIRRPM